MPKFDFDGQRIICAVCGAVTESLYGESFEAVWERGEGRCETCETLGRTRAVVSVAGAPAETDSEPPKGKGKK